MVSDGKLENKAEVVLDGNYSIGYG